MKVKNAIEQKKNGIYYNNRILLPFKCEFLKVIFEDKIITNFSSSNPDIEIVEHENFTDIYFKKYKDIQNEFSQYEPIKIIVCEKDEDIFDFKNHIKLLLYLENEHLIKIELPDENQIIID
ncbi:MAG: hypothetical protein N3F03_06475 [Ignavibacteria bacterium]|nr:hypothetical protein [Ignavibacteria bacterium]